MKRTEYYNSQEELNNYYPDGIPSTVLAIVKGEEGKSVLFTTSNNESAGGTMEDQGGYNIDEDTQEKIEVSYEFATDTGASKTYVADYVYTYAQTTDLSSYVSKTELSNCGYITAQDVPAPDLSAYATTSYVTENYFQKTGGPINGDVFLNNNNSGNPYKFYIGGVNRFSASAYISSWVGPYLHIRDGLNLSFKIRDNYGDLLWINDSDLKIKGIGNFTGNNHNNSYGLAYVINDLQSQISNIPSGGEDNVQADWNESDSSSDAYIRNKPNISQTTVGNSTYVTIGESLNEHIYPASANRWNIGAEDNAFNVIYAGAFNQVGVGDLNKKINGIFSQDEANSGSKAAVQYTYSGKVVDYISYLDLPTKDYVQDNTSFVKDDDGKTQGIVDALVGTGILTEHIGDHYTYYYINQVSTIAGDKYWENDDNYLEDAFSADNPVENDSPDNSLYNALDYAGVFDWVEGEDERGNAYSYTWINKLATKNYVDSLIGTAASIAEIIVGNNS